MKQERFDQLLATYGANPAKWPVTERVESPSPIPAQEAGTRDAIADAAMLDKLLDSYRVTAADRGLVDRIVASAPKPSGGGWFAPLWSSLGMAGVAAGGVLAGIMFMSSVLTPTASTILPSASPTELSYLTTAFGGSAPLWSEE